MTSLDHGDSKKPRRVLIETWGCQMNVADSEKMLSLLEQESYQPTDDVDAADLILLNTCHIRDKAKHKVLSRLGILSRLKKQRPDLKIAVSGCVAQAEGKKLLAQSPAIDLLLGPGKIDTLPQLLRNHDQSKKTQLSLGFDGTPNSGLKEATPQTLPGKSEVSRYVNIMQGCNNFCTFCVVPFTRGREISTPAAQVVDEVRRMVAHGAKEVTLLGQNVNSYGLDLPNTKSDEGPFVDLLRQVAKIPDLVRLRFTTSNPHDFTLPLAKLFAEQPKLGRYVHLPVQSGDDQVLARMKRKVTVEQYWQRIGWLRQHVPSIALSTDLIVGFPGETDDQFQNTLKLVEKVRFNFVYAFAYSARKGTAAARFPDKIDPKTQQARLTKLNELQDQITTEINQAAIGKTFPVLFHYESRKEPGIFYGRTDQFQLVRVASRRNILGQCLPVNIEQANRTALAGHLA